MSSSEFRDELQLRFTSGGITAHGERAPPIVRYKEDATERKPPLKSVADLLKSADPMQFTKIMDAVNKRVQGQNAAKSAIDIALHDWVGQKLGLLCTVCLEWIQKTRWLPISLLESIPRR